MLLNCCPHQQIFSQMPLARCLLFQAFRNFNKLNIVAWTETNHLLYLLEKKTAIEFQKLK